MRLSNIQQNRKTRLIQWAVVLVSISFSPVAGAIDNPESKVVERFKERSRPYLDSIYSASKSEDGTVQAYYRYERFLDLELNQVFAALLNNLSGDTRRDLVTSQKKWLAYRDAEFIFIGSNWIPGNFGSSYRVSKFSYRTNFLENRVIELNNYLQNY